MTSTELDEIKRAADAAALDVSAFVRSIVIQHVRAQRPNIIPMCPCNSEPGVHRVPYVTALLGDRCLRSTDWAGFASKLPAEEARAFSRFVGEMLVPRAPVEVKVGSPKSPARKESKRAT